MNNNTSKNILYIDVIKIIACFLVIVNHTQSFMFNHDGEYIGLYYSLFFSICKIAVPLFIMVSGALLLDKNYDFKKIFKSIYRIFIPLVFMSFLIYVKTVGISNINLIDFIKGFISEPIATALWYLYMLIGLYLVTPFIQKMVKGFKDSDYRIFILIFLLIPAFISLLKIYIPFNTSSYFTYAFIPSLLGYYVAGSYLSKIKPNKKFVIYSSIIFIVSYFGMVLAMYIPYVKGGELSYNLDNYIALPVILMALSFSYIVKYIYNDKVSSNVINEIAKTTFGIYLIHFIMNYKIYNMFMVRILNWNVYVGILLLEIATFIICSIIIWLLRKIPIIKKFL